CHSSLLSIFTHSITIIFIQLYSLMSFSSLHCHYYNNILSIHISIMTIVTHMIFRCILYHSTDRYSSVLMFSETVIDFNLVRHALSLFNNNCLSEVF
ncbi:hypothetical protein EGX56_19785, partial [Escherichia coli]|nr:hypothetical protein [Escherichia coli]